MDLIPLALSCALLHRNAWRRAKRMLFVNRGWNWETVTLICLVFQAASTPASALCVALLARLFGRSLALEAVGLKDNSRPHGGKDVIGPHGEPPLCNWSFLQQYHAQTVRRKIVYARCQLPEAWSSAFRHSSISGKMRMELQVTVFRSIMSKIPVWELSPLSKRDTRRKILGAFLII